MKLLKRLRHRLAILMAAVVDPGTFRIAYKSFCANQTLQKPLELFRCIRWLKKQGLRNVMEIGSWQGGTLYVWSQISAKDANLISLDLNRVGDNGELVKRFHSLVQSSQHLVCLRQDSHLPTSLEATKMALDGRKLDFLFIDGDHTYEGVKQDFEMYGPLVKSGGFVAFHDITDNPEVPVYGVAKFWRELREKFEHVEFIDHISPINGCGIGILRLPT